MLKYTLTKYFFLSKEHSNDGFSDFTFRNSIEFNQKKLLLRKIHGGHSLLFLMRITAANVFLLNSLLTNKLSFYCNPKYNYFNEVKSNACRIFFEFSSSIRSKKCKLWAIPLISNFFPSILIWVQLHGQHGVTLLDYYVRGTHKKFGIQNNEQ